jgi:hypothetical protein
VALRQPAAVVARAVRHDVRAVRGAAMRRAPIEASGMLACAGVGVGCSWLAVVALDLPDPSGATNVFALVVAFGVTFASWSVLRKRLRR